MIRIGQKTRFTKRGGVPLLFLFLFISFVYAAPPVGPQSSEEDVGTLTIIFPKIETYAYGQDTKFHFHVFNSSDKLLNINDSLWPSCRMHIYNNINAHIAETILTPDGNGEEFSFTLSKTLGLKGDYSYMVWCNNTREYGFLSNSFSIEKNGEAKDQTLNFQILGGYFILMFIIFIMIHAFKKDQSAVIIYGTLGGIISLLYEFLILLDYYVPADNAFRYFLAALVAAMSVYSFIIGYIFWQDIKDQNKTEAERSNGVT